MTDKEKSLEEKLKVLEIMFLNKLPGRLEEITQALAQFVAAPHDKEALDLIHRLLHTMAGSAGTFGFDDVGEEARTYDNKLKALIAGAVWTEDDVANFNKEVTDYVAATYRTIELKKAEG